MLDAKILVSCNFSQCHGAGYGLLWDGWDVTEKEVTGDKETMEINKRAEIGVNISGVTGPR